MIKNYYYLSAGILAIIFAVAHLWNGQNGVLQTLHVTPSPTDTKTMFLYVWHIISAENLVFGITFFFMSFSKDLSKVRFSAWTIVFLMIARWVVIIGSTLIYNAKGFESTWTESLAFAIFISIIILGIRVKDNHIKDT